MAECRLYKIAHLQSSRSELRLPYFNRPYRPDHASSNRRAGHFSPCHCSLRPTPHMIRYRQAAACPRAAQKSATFRSLRSPQWQSWCRRQAQFNSGVTFGVGPTARCSSVRPSADLTVLPWIATGARNAHESVWKKAQASLDDRHQTSDQKIDA